MKVINKKAGYSAEKYDEQFGKDTPYFLLGSGIETVLHYDEEQHKYTDEVEALRAELYYPGKGTVKVKLPARFSDDLADFTRVKLVSPEAYIDRKNNIYLRSEGMEAVND